MSAATNRATDYLDENGDFKPVMLEHARANNSFFDAPCCEWTALLAKYWDENFSLWPRIMTDREYPTDSYSEIAEGSFTVCCGIMRAACDLFSWEPLWNHFGLYLNDDILPVWRDIDQVAQLMLRLNRLPQEVAKRKCYVNVWLFDIRQNILAIKKRADPTCPRYTKGRKKDTFWMHHPTAENDTTPSARPTASVVITLAYGEANRYIFAAVSNASSKNYQLFYNAFGYRFVGILQEE